MLASLVKIDSITFRGIILITLDNMTINNKLAKVLSISLVALAVSACTQTDPARIQNLSDSSSSVYSATSNDVADSTSSSTYSQPPANISQAQKNQVQQSSTSTVIQSTTGTETTTQERMVYNRNYDAIPKGGYQGNTYTVKRGDTLFYVAWITGNDFRSLAAKNNIAAPYDLNVGQVLDVGDGTTIVTKQTTTNTNAIKPTTTITTTTTTGSAPATKVTTTSTSTSNIPTAATSTATNNATPSVANIQWQWPVKGKVVETFTNASKGIDIAGTLGERIDAAAAGRVVYAGNSLPGYGNLIIIKHNDDYLTAYAHNQTILVKEQQEVNAGQQIATMGNSGTNSVRLHFEVRYQVKSVDPLKYLPK